MVHVTNQFVPDPHDKAFFYLKLLISLSKFAGPMEYEIRIRRKHNASHYINKQKSTLKKSIVPRSGLEPGSLPCRHTNHCSRKAGDLWFVFQSQNDRFLCVDFCFHILTHAHARACVCVWVDWGGLQLWLSGWMTGSLDGW